MVISIVDAHSHGVLLPEQINKFMKIFYLMDKYSSISINGE